MLPLIIWVLVYLRNEYLNRAIPASCEKAQEAERPYELIKEILNLIEERGTHRIG